MPNPPILAAGEAMPDRQQVEITKKGETYIAGLKASACPAGVEPRLWRDAVSTRANWHLDRATRLLAILDHMDGCADLEPYLSDMDLAGRGDDREADWSDNEPDLGAPECAPAIKGNGRTKDGSQEHAWRLPHHDDREDDGDDLEPSLCGMGVWINCKHEYDLEEDRSDYEPSLGAPERSPGLTSQESHRGEYRDSDGSQLGAWKTLVQDLEMSDDTEIDSQGGDDETHPDMLRDPTAHTMAQEAATEAKKLRSRRGNPRSSESTLEIVMGRPDGLCG